MSTAAANLAERANEFRRAYGTVHSRNRQSHRRHKRHCAWCPDVPVRRRPRLWKGCPVWVRPCWCAPSARYSILKFKRIQFTPDLNAVGHPRHQHHQRIGGRQARLQFPTRSDVRADRVADEVNRRRRKPVAMLERCRSTASRFAAPFTKLEEPFFVMATQKPDRTGGHLSAARGAARRFFSRWS